MFSFLIFCCWWWWVCFFVFCCAFFAKHHPSGIPHIPQDALQNYIHETSPPNIIISQIKSLNGFSSWSKAHLGEHRYSIITIWLSFGCFEKEVRQAGCLQGNLSNLSHPQHSWHTVANANMDRAGTITQAHLHPGQGALQAGPAAGTFHTPPLPCRKEHLGLSPHIQCHDW